jgi:YD repeat-containing protein
MATFLIIGASAGLLSGAASALPNDPPYETGDEFNGAELDPAIWSIGSDARWCSPSGAWRVIASQACQGLTQNPPYGSLSVAGGEARFTAAPDTRAFPYAWTRDDVFAPAGDFVVDVRMRYDSLTNHGDGLHAKRWADPTPVGDNSPYAQGAVRCGTFGIWGDSGLGKPAPHIPGIEVPISGSATGYHDYRFQYANGKYFVFVDGRLWIGPVASTIVPNRIWAGNPLFTDSSIDDWSDFTLDYIRISEPASIDTDGNGVYDGVQSWTPVNVPAAAQQDSDSDGLPDHCDPSPGQAQPGPSAPPEQTFGPGPGIHAVNPSGYFSDPVNSATGSFVASVTDVALTGIGVPFVLTRSYTSADTAVSSLGPGWRHSYAAELVVAMNGSVLLYGEDGQRVTFARKADGSYVGGAGARSRLSAVGGGYELVRHDQVRYSFNAAGRLTSMRDRNGRSLTFDYDPDGRLATARDAAGRTVLFTHDGAGLLTKVEMPDGRAVSYAYTAGRLSSVTDVRGGTTLYAYDPTGRLIQEIDANGHIAIRNTYGVDGRVIEQLDALENRTTFSWDAATQAASAIDAGGNEWKDVYANNLLVRRIDPVGNAKSLNYDYDLNRIAVTDARGNTTNLGYDARGNLLRATEPSVQGYRETFRYDAQNNLVRTTDSRSNTTTYTYDSAGNLIRVAEPGAVTTEIGRDAETGLPTSFTDGLGNVTHLSYDAAGNLTRVTSPLGAVTTMEYDAAGRVTSLVGPRGN